MDQQPHPWQVMQAIATTALASGRGGNVSIIEAWFVQRIQRNRRRPSSRRKARPGWYYDPRRQARYRYWTGSTWSDETAERLPT